VQLGKLRKKDMTTSTPRTVADLKHQDWVIEKKFGKTIQESAEQEFNHVFPGDDRPVTVRTLFTEDNVRVYEADKDSGSVDYLYIKELV